MNSNGAIWRRAKSTAKSTLHMGRSEVYSGVQYPLGVAKASRTERRSSFTRGSCCWACRMQELRDYSAPVPSDCPRCLAFSVTVAVWHFPHRTYVHLSSSLATLDRYLRKLPLDRTHLSRCFPLLGVRALRTSSFSHIPDFDSRACRRT